MSEQQNRQVNRVVVIVPHADDIEFGMAGTIANWTDAGIQVTYCIITDGSAGSNDPTVKRDELIARREAEQLKAAAEVGVTDVRFLRYQDGILEPSIALRRDLTRIIRQVRPEIVACFDPTTLFSSNEYFDYINHPDHVAAAVASVHAVFPSAETRPIFPELLDEGLEPHHVSELWMNLTDKANHKVDISAQIERKLAALRAHESQLGEDVVKMVREWSAESGRAAGCEYAEDFRIMRFWNDSGIPLGEQVEQKPVEEQ